MLELLTPQEIDAIETEVILLAGFTVFSFIIYWFFIYRARRDQKTAEIQQSCEETLRSEDLPPQVQETPRLQQRLLWSAELAAARRLTEEQRQQQPPDDREAFDRSLYNKMMYWEQTDRCFAYADDRLDGFVSRLRGRYPQLTDSDLQLLLLYTLQVPQNDLLTLMNYSPNRLPTTKQRLCRKLNLDSALHLPEQICELLSTL